MRTEGGREGGVRMELEKLAAAWQSSQAYGRHLCQSRKPRWRVRTYATVMQGELVGTAARV